MAPSRAAAALFHQGKNCPHALHNKESSFPAISTPLASRRFTQKLLAEHGLPGLQAQRGVSRVEGDGVLDIDDSTSVTETTCVSRGGVGCSSYPRTSPPSFRRERRRPPRLVQERKPLRTASRWRPSDMPHRNFLTMCARPSLRCPRADPQAAMLHTLWRDSTAEVAPALCVNLKEATTTSK